MPKMVFEQFDNLDAFVRALDRPVNSVFRNQRLSSHNTDRDEWNWYGTKSYDEALNLLRNGWTEKADEIRSEFVKFEAQQKTVSYEKHRPSTSVVGFTPHVPNAIMGLPNSMIQTERTPMKAKVIRLILNLGMNSGTNSNDIMRAGLTILKIAYSMERKGYRVRIDVTPKFSNSGSEKTCAMVCVKDWRQPIDIKKIAFPIANPSMFRRLGFRWLETVPTLTERGYASGYGRSFEDVDKEKAILKECGAIGDNDYYLNVALAKKNGFDVVEVANAIGIKSLGGN